MKSKKKEEIKTAGAKSKLYFQQQENGEVITVW